MERFRTALVVGLAYDVGTPDPFRTMFYRKTVICLSIFGSVINHGATFPGEMPMREVRLRKHAASPWKWIHLTARETCLAEFRPCQRTLHETYREGFHLYQMNRSVFSQAPRQQRFPRESHQSPHEGETKISI